MKFQNQTFSLLIFFFYLSNAFSSPNLNPSLKILNENALQNLKIETVEVAQGSFVSTLFAIGQIQVKPSHKSALSTRIPGRITKIHAYEGESVTENQILAEIETRKVGNPSKVIPLRAKKSGIILNSYIQLGEPVEPQKILMEIYDPTILWAIAKIPEGQISKILIGAQSEIYIPAIGNKRIKASLLRFGTSTKTKAGTLDAIFELKHPEFRVLPNMRAEFSIIVSQRENVFSIPIHCIQGSESNPYVFVRDFDLENAFIKTPVVIGEKNKDRVEIINGLFPSDEVVTSGSYALSFVGNESAISLKEALDAAHGHEHNEDGSEITGSQNAKASKVNSQSSKIHWILYTISGYALIITLIALFLLQKSIGIKDSKI